MTVRRLLFVAFALVLAVGMSVAQQGPKKDVGKKVPLPGGIDVDEKTDRLPQTTLSIDVELVNVDVVVTDNRGNPVTGLEKHHFKIFEDNVEQTITNFSPTDAPLTVVILVEFSDTIGYYFDDVVEPAAGFINSLRADDWGALVAFDIRPEILTDFTKNKAELFNGLRRLQIPAYRETSLYDAVYFTLERMENVDGKKAIFLLSAGLDTISKHSYPETLRKAEGSDTMIYSVGMGQLARLHLEQYMGPMDSITFLQADNVMRSLAEATGGVGFFPRFPGEYPRIYELLSAHLRSQYSIGYAPKVRKTDGKLRKLRVEVPDMDVNRDGKLDKLKVRHKKGYYSPKS